MCVHISHSHATIRSHVSPRLVPRKLHICPFYHYITVGPNEHTNGCTKQKLYTCISQIQIGKIENVLPPSENR